MEMLMGLLSNLRAKAAERAAEAAERAAEAARIEEEKKQAEIARLTQMSEKELLVDIYMKLNDFEKRVSSIESKLKETSDEVNQLYIDHLTK